MMIFAVPLTARSVRVLSYSGLHLPAFRLITERYGVSLSIQAECGKILTRITPNMYIVYVMPLCLDGP